MAQQRPKKEKTKLEKDENLDGQIRRQRLLKKLQESAEPLTGSFLALHFHVSRQVIVTDIALLRASGSPILSTSRGYLLTEEENDHFKRVFKVQHSEAMLKRELQLIVDYGGKVVDVFVYHKVYGKIQGPLNISSRLDVTNYLEEIKSGSSTPLMKITSGYHYHTVEAESEKTLDLIQEALEKEGFLAPLTDYEPVNFWPLDSETGNKKESDPAE